MFLYGDSGVLNLLFQKRFLRIHSTNHESFGTDGPKKVLFQKRFWKCRVQLPCLRSGKLARRENSSFLQTICVFTVQIRTNPLGAVAGCSDAARRGGVHAAMQRARLVYVCTVRTVEVVVLLVDVALWLKSPSCRSIPPPAEVHAPTSKVFAPSRFWENATDFFSMSQVVGAGPLPMQPESYPKAVKYLCPRLLRGTPVAPTQENL